MPPADGRGRGGRLGNQREPQPHGGEAAHPRGGEFGGKHHPVLGNGPLHFDGHASFADGRSLGFMTCARQGVLRSAVPARPLHRNLVNRRRKHWADEEGTRVASRTSEDDVC